MDTKRVILCFVFLYSINCQTEPLIYNPCTTAEDERGTCVESDRCPPLLRPAPSLISQTLCGSPFDTGSKPPQICCPLSRFPNPPTAPPPPPPTTTTTTTGPPPTTPQPSPVRAGGDYRPLLDPPVCGNISGFFPRVIGGDPAPLGAFPWMALLGYNKNNSITWGSDGSLITTRHVLTAGHSVFNETSLRLVRLGELDLNREDEGATPIDIPIKRSIVHEQYRPNTLNNDIAILVLEEDVTFTTLIQPLCIPRSPELRALAFKRCNPLAAGWGSTLYKGTLASHLQFIQLPVTSNEYCAGAYMKLKNLQLDASVICAGLKNGGRGTCSGDSGAPLMQAIERYDGNTLRQYFYQIGLVSYSTRCAMKGFPTVFSRVTHFAPWIQEQVTGYPPEDLELPETRQLCVPN